KSTLLEAIAVAWGFNAEGGSKNFRFGTRASHSTLSDYLRLVKGVRKPRDGFFLRAESFFNVATEIERLEVGDSYGARSLHEQSHGESFLALMTHRFGGQGFYLLDEPEAALSPQRGRVAVRRRDALADPDGLPGRHALQLLRERHRAGRLLRNRALSGDARLSRKSEAHARRPARARGRRAMRIVIPASEVQIQAVR